MIFKFLNRLESMLGGSSMPVDVIVHEGEREEPGATDGAESRAYIEPIRGDNADVARLVFGGGRTSAGVAVSEVQSLSISAVYSCVRVLAESISSLPLKLYERSGRARATATNHSLYDVLQVQGNDLMSAMKMREVMVVHLLLWGNSYSEIERDNGGRIVALWPVHPIRVQVRVVKENGLPRLKYDISKEAGGSNELDQDNVLHISGLGTGIMGKSPIQLHRESLGISIAAKRYGAKFFANDARPGFVLTHPGVMGDEAYNRFKESWQEKHQGSENAYMVSILEEGMKPEKVGLPPGDAQFIETRKFEKSEVAAIYRVPPHMIGDLDRATYSNIEQQGIEFVTHSLRPWLVRVEQAMNMRLLTREERRRFFTEHLVDGLLRGDSASRFKAYATARQWGWMSADDIRELENQNPLPNNTGQEYLRPMNMIPVGEEPADARGLAPGGLARRGAAPGGRTPGGLEVRAVPPRVNAAAAIEPVYLDTFTRIVKREIVELKRGIRKHLEAGDVEAFREWLEAFTIEHASWALKRLLPVLEAMAAAMVDAANDELGLDDPPVSLDDDLSQFLADYSEAAANRHAGGMRGQLVALLEEDEPQAAIETRLDEWGETRADKQARRERERSSNAFTKAAWVIAGVASITWRASGENCPMCDELNGRTTQINLPFLDAGVDFLGLVTSGTVGHPPLHDGCDCYLEANITRGHIPTHERRQYLDLLLETIAKREHAE